MKADFEKLFRNYYRPLTVYAMQFLGDQQAAEDVVQDTFLYLFRNAEKQDVNRHNLYRLTRFRYLNRWQLNLNTHDDDIIDLFLYLFVLTNIGLTIQSRNYNLQFDYLLRPHLIPGPYRDDINSFPEGGKVDLL